MKLVKILLAAMLSIFWLSLLAQNPEDLSRVKASQISDEQLQQYIKEAKSRGLGLDELQAELVRRGLPRAEAEELMLRAQQMDVGVSGSDTSSRSNQQGRKYANEYSKSKPFQADDWRKEKKITLFGAELFSNENLSFEPDIRMATPSDYTIGPDDELQLNIYGQNVSQQTLKVTPEGNVNVRYAGVINLNGLTIEAANDLLKSRLGKYYPALKNGQTKVQLTLATLRSIRVTIIGAVNRPGTYTLPSVSSFYNALYVSGGPSENGSFRNIELIRGNKLKQKADLYDFLIRGNQTANIRLQDNDVIRVPFAQLLVTVKGEVNRPAIFEVKPGEMLSDVFEFAGSFKSKAFRSRITGNRFGKMERIVLDIAGDSLSSFQPMNGDEYLVDSLLNRFRNRVIISGAVFKPGQYALDPQMTLDDLIAKAQGLKEDVFDGSAILVRTRKNLTKEYLTSDLRDLLMGGKTGILLQKEDSVHIASLFDLKDTSSISINGAVRTAGKFRFEDSMTLKALIIKAGGFKDEATADGIEISRRKRNVMVNKVGSQIVDLIVVNGDLDLSKMADVTLQPFDIVSVKENPFYKKQISVKISGEVLMPSIYSLQSREERLSSLIKRSGGLLYTANIKGAKLVRQNKVNVDTSEVKRLLTTIKRDTIATRDSAVVKTTRDVAIDMAYILQHPGSEDDIVLEDGDELVVPRLNNTVSVNGQVFNPLDIMFEKGKSIRDYVSDAGGVTLRGKRSRTFIIYANGRSAKIKKVMGIFPRYPKVEPGSSIYVPEKPAKGEFDAAKGGILISAITALITAVALLTR